MKQTVETIANNDLCTSCGLCTAACQHGAISYERKKGIYVPVIDTQKCTKCGLCYQVCPGKGYDYAGITESRMFFGEYRQIITIQSKNDELLAESASGGFITHIVRNLLRDKLYDCAFLVNGYTYSEKLSTEKFTATSDFFNTPKSRYIPINHSPDFEYILSHKEEKVILVGTPCFIHGALNFIRKFHLKRENYLLIGLFCDRTMTYDVWDYFEYLTNDHFSSLFFRDKKCGGYPGNMCYVNKKGKCKEISRTERMFAKSFFMPESCLYCLDKLNDFSDFSVGDNWTGKHDDGRGSNSVILRTPLAEEILNLYKSEFKIDSSDEKEIVDSQNPGARKVRESFIQCKQCDVFDENMISKPESVNLAGESYQQELARIKLGSQRKFYLIRLKKLRFDVATMFRKLIKK